MFNNPNGLMFLNRNRTIDTFGNDKTGKIQYKFDQYGFRHSNNYNTHPEYVFFGCSALFGVGIDVSKRFTSKFNCWNFGLAGIYTENEILQTYSLFKKKNKFKCKVIFVWRDMSKVPAEILSEDSVFHCLPVSSKKRNHIRLLENLDYDTSGTHWGIKTHEKFSKLLWHFLK